MTQEEKELLLKDLSARLPYRVLFMVYDSEMNEPVELLSINPKHNKPLEIDDGYDENSSTYWNLEDVKPYLRPMSSMTEEEKKELGNFVAAIMFASQNKNHLFQLTREALVGDFFNKHHFDYRGLIKKGLALEAPEGMYDFKKK